MSSLLKRDGGTSTRFKEALVDVKCEARCIRARSCDRRQALSYWIMSQEQLHDVSYVYISFLCFCLYCIHHKKKYLALLSALALRVQIDYFLLFTALCRYTRRTRQRADDMGTTAQIVTHVCAVYTYPPRMTLLHFKRHSGVTERSAVITVSMILACGCAICRTYAPCDAEKAICTNCTTLNSMRWWRTLAETSWHRGIRVSWVCCTNKYDLNFSETPLQYYMSRVF